MELHRYTTLGFVVSLHCALFAIAARPASPGGSFPTLAFGGLSVLVLALSLYHELAWRV